LAILPVATDDSMTTFEAKGKFANDDGLTVDTAGTKKLNLYEIDFEAKASTSTAMIQIHRVEPYLADPEVVNNNDLLG